MHGGLLRDEAVLSTAGSFGAEKRHSSHALNYRPEIDGLRAIAILSVVIFHAELGFFGGGFIGVDVFFVISGFLISSIILKESREGAFSYLTFYKRRTLRIFPALFTVIAACFLAGWFILPPHEYKEMANSAIATAAFYSNFYFENNSDYFAAEAITMPLLHTWSLAVEEQFYFLAPALLLLCVRYPRFARPAFILVFLASLLFSVFLIDQNATKAFYMLPSRAFELMTGAALAMGLVPALRSRATAEIASAAGLVMIAFAALAYSSETAFPGFAALLPCVGAALVIHANQNTATLTGRTLGTAPFVFIGKISYSLYLWHWPFLVFAIFEYGTEIGPGARIGLMAAAMAVSVLSYYLIEQPARQRGARLKAGLVLIIGVTAILACLLARTYVRKTDGAFWRLPPVAADFAASNPSKVNTAGLCRDPNGSRSDVSSDCQIGAPGVAPQFLLFGDSHAQAISNEVAAIASRHGIAGHALTRSGCPPVVGLNEAQAEVFGKCVEQYAALDGLLSEESIRTVVIISRWAPYITGRTMPNESGKRRRFFAETEEGNRIEFERLVTETVEKIRDSGRRVVILGPFPELGFNLTAEMTKALMQGKPADFTIERSMFNERQKEVLPFLARLGTLQGVEVLYPHDMLCNDSTCRTQLDGKALYVDDDHLSPTGAAFIGPLIEKALGQ
jgi:peptidoglycan/LPS O-acetylase OafA/YrhL